MDPTTIAICIATNALAFVLGFVLGTMRLRARTTLEKKALEAMRLGDHPPLYKYEDPPIRDEKTKV